MVEQVSSLFQNNGIIMALDYRTIKKFFKEHFKGKNPIKVTSSKRKELAETIKQRLVGLHNVSTEKHRRYYMSKDRVNSLIYTFFINDPTSDGYYSSNDFNFYVGEQMELTIEGSYSSAVVSDIDEVLAFISACQERLDRKNAQKRKREKVRDFKAQAIIAQVKKLAKEEKFDFYTQTDTVKLKLYVKLSDKVSIELHIPFKRFQEVLPNLQKAILALKELSASGIKFKVRSPSSYGWHSWITHESLE